MLADSLLTMRRVRRSTSSGAVHRPRYPGLQYVVHLPAQEACKPI